MVLVSNIFWRVLVILTRCILALLAALRFPFELPTLVTVAVKYYVLQVPQTVLPEKLDLLQDPGKSVAQILTGLKWRRK